MGFYTQYFSTLLKNIRATAFKERWESRKIVNKLKDSDHRLYKSLFEKVEKTHEVSKAIREEGKLLKSLQIAAENADKLMFNVETEEITLLKTIEEILKELETFSKAVKGNGEVKKLELELLQQILLALRKAEVEDQKEFKQVRTIIVLSEGKNVGNFMQELRLRFQEKDVQTILAKFALRHEARKALTDILKLRRIPSQIRHLTNKLTKDKKAKTEDIVSELYVIIREIKQYLNDAFYELFLIMKRDTLFMLKILYDLNNLFNFNLKWIGKSYMPPKAVGEKNKKIFEIEQKISKDFHTFAQAFNIILKKIGELEKIVQVELATVSRSK